MNYIDEIFERMDLRRISAYVVDGSGASSRKSGMTYAECLKNGSDPIYKRLEGIYCDTDELNKAVADLYRALNAYEEVYMEIGMKTGARVLYQLLHEREQLTESGE